MIHIATVHARSDRWIDVQLRYLRRHISEPYRIYASLGEIDGSHASRFHFARVEQGKVRHRGELNSLYTAIARESDDRDVLIFADGDAFPIADLSVWIADTLSRFPLAAVRRDELFTEGDCPHPCFCVTTVGFWREIGGDWVTGQTWQNAAGEWVRDEREDVGQALARLGVEWMRMRRTNVRELHPLFFGVYGHLVYHHGAGFRLPVMSPLDYREIEQAMAASGVEGDQRAELEQRLERERASRNSRLSEDVFEALRSNHSFWRELFY